MTHTQEQLYSELLDCHTLIRSPMARLEKIQGML